MIEVQLAVHWATNIDTGQVDALRTMMREDPMRAISLMDTFDQTPIYVLASTKCQHCTDTYPLSAVQGACGWTDCFVPKAHHHV